jgi:hypothetical protein
MKFKLGLWGYCGLLVVPLAQAGVLDDYSTVVARTDEPRLIVTYQDGSQEAYQPEWRATLTVHREEPGHVSKPLQGDVIDTRECRWTIQGQIERTLRLCTRTGCTARVEPSADQPAPGAITTLEPIQREPPPLAERILRLAPDLCSDTDAQFRAAVDTPLSAMRASSARSCSGSTATRPSGSGPAAAGVALSATTSAQSRE